MLTKVSTISFHVAASNVEIRKMNVFISSKDILKCSWITLKNFPFKIKKTQLPDKSEWPVKQESRTLIE